MIHDSLDNAIIFCTPPYALGQIQNSYLLKVFILHWINRLENGV